MKEKTKKCVNTVRKRISAREKSAQSAENKPVSDSKRKPANYGKSKRELSTSKHGSKCPTKEMKAKVKRDKNGHVLKGSGSNGGGRPKGTFRPSLNNLNRNEMRQAILEFELKYLKKSKRMPAKYKNWLEHQIKKSFDDTTLGVTLLKMMYPTLKSVEQLNINADIMDVQEAEEIQKMRKEMDERCKRVLESAERKIKS